MGLFSIFKKNEPTYDSSNIRVQDLDIGFVFEYNLSTWVVKAVMEYDWGNENFSRELQVSNGSEMLFLGIEEDDELELSLMKKVKLRSIQNDLTDLLISQQEPPKTLNHEGVEYYLEEETPGYFRNITKKTDWEEMRLWNFEDKTGKHLLSVEQWDEKEFEASIGISIEEFEISNILPGEG